jgi:predicted O-methyltransferase YrrM
MRMLERAGGRLRMLTRTIAAHALSAVLPAGLMRDKRYFELWERRGYHVLPVQYYEPVPDMSALPDFLWNARPDPPAIDFRESAQADLADRFSRLYGAEYRQFSRTQTEDSGFFLENGGFESVDAEVLYCMVRDRRPRRIVEVGSGSSTLLIAQALEMNGRCGSSQECEVIIVDPYARSGLEDVLPKQFQVVRQLVQEVPLTRFLALQENDILFIDSTHVVATGSDVVYECLEIVPRLNPGVLVHFHDIFLPDDYPAEWLRRDRWFWTEQYLVQALLAFNERFEVLWGSAYMLSRRPEVVGRAFPTSGARSLRPASLWISRAVD